MKMRPRHLLAIALLPLGACSALRPDAPLERDAEHRLERGLAALDAAEYREAFDDLSWVYAHCPAHTRGAEALLALAALELDPRNPAGRPGVATDLLARLLAEPAAEGYVRPMAEAAYLMALSLGAPDAADGAATLTAGPATGVTARDSARPVARAVADTSARVVRAAEVLEAPAEEPAVGCGRPVTASAWAAPRLPELPGPSLVSLLAAAERARAGTAAEAETLRGELAAARQRLQETEAELERIRQTLKP